MMKKRLSTRMLLILLLAASVLLPSCKGAVEKARQNIRVEGVEAIDLHGLSGADLTLRVRNDTPHKLVLREASFTLWLEGVRVGDIELLEKVEVPRRTTESVTARWRFRIDDPLSLYVLTRRLRAGDLAQVGVSCEVNGRGGPIRVKISQQMVPLSDFLRNFGLKTEDLMRYFNR